MHAGARMLRYTRTQPIASAATPNPFSSSNSSSSPLIAADEAASVALEEGLTLSQVRVLHLSQKRQDFWLLLRRFSPRHYTRSLCGCCVIMS